MAAHLSKPSLRGHVGQALQEEGALRDSLISHLCQLWWQLPKGLSQRPDVVPGHHPDCHLGSAAATVGHCDTGCL